MEEIEFEASEYLAHTLEKFTGAPLSVEERHPAFMLACTMPNRSVVRDFIEAASEANVVEVGLSVDVARILAPLVDRLGSVAYAARFASIIESRDSK